MIELRWKQVDPMYPNSIEVFGKDNILRDVETDFLVLQYREVGTTTSYTYKGEVCRTEIVHEWKEVIIEDG